ncbi:MAG: hypothetical protein LKK00_07105 [Intestinimonas sp.]|nr:hypothetical protein [Intestinimonas sp.]
MKHGTSRFSPLGTGVLTVFNVLVILLMAVLAVLALSSARADLVLSRINADTVSAYYRADAQAAALKKQFLAGSTPELEVTLPMTQAQNLYIHLVRTENGGCRVLAWQTVPTQASLTGEEDTLPVWDGTPPGT